MATVRATLKGYYGGKLRECGEVFTLAHSDWRSHKKRPSWVEATNMNEVTTPDDDICESEMASLGTPPDWVEPQ